MSSFQEILHEAVNSDGELPPSEQSITFHDMSKNGGLFADYDLAYDDKPFICVEEIDEEPCGRDGKANIED